MKRGATLLGDLALVAVAVALMLTCAAMIFIGPSSALAFSLITVGIALTVIARVDKRRRHPGI